MDQKSTSKHPSTRPLSPHLQVYKPQLTSILSIVHRGTGVMLSITAFLCVLGLYHLKTNTSFDLLQQLLPALMTSFVCKVLIVLVTFSLFFHMSNGVRHLFWDMGKGFELKTVYRSGYAVLIISIVCTILLLGDLL